MDQDKRVRFELMGLQRLRIACFDGFDIWMARGRKPPWVGNKQEHRLRRGQHVILVAHDSRCSGLAPSVKEI